eukprot:5854900-Pleurochrysis_carterae.AAC.1
MKHSALFFSATAFLSRLCSQLDCWLLPLCTYFNIALDDFYRASIKYCEGLNMGVAALSRTQRSAVFLLQRKTPGCERRTAQGALAVRDGVRRRSWV